MWDGTTWDGARRKREDESSRFNGYYTLARSRGYQAVMRPLSFGISPVRARRLDFSGGRARQAGRPDGAGKQY